ncbi:MAG: hypothetical protein R2873_34605 [Caldilineaceae bacterium]
MRVNEIFLGIDTYLSHIISSTIVPRGGYRLSLGLCRGWRYFCRADCAAQPHTGFDLATVTLVLSIGVGLLGAYFPSATPLTPSPVSERLTLDLLVSGAARAGAMAFALAGVLGISAAWIESPADSGRLILWGDHINYPTARRRPTSSSWAWAFWRR